MASAPGLLLVLAGCADRAVVDHATERTSGVHKASAGGSMDASNTGTTSCATAGDTVGESTGASSTDAIDDPCGPPGPTSADLAAPGGLAEVFFA